MTTPTAEEIEAAARVLRAGGLVAFPTETVYGLGADAANPQAVRRIYAAKGRPANHPLIVHLPSAEAVPAWALDVPPAAHALADACWPGPLTVLLRRHPRVDATATGGRDTIGLRVPGHPVALALLRAFGGGVAAPSANRFGHVSPTTAEHVRADLGGSVDVILDGGPSAVGVESTIVDLTVEPPVVLRPGGIATATIAAVLGTQVTSDPEGPSRAPGMLAAHYAPRAQVMVIEDATAAAAEVAALRAAGRRAELLDPGGDPEHYAQGLYAWLRAADEGGAEVVVAVPPAAEGVGWAVRDRLQKAAASSREPPAG